MFPENIEENLVPFAEYVRKGRQGGPQRTYPLSQRLARVICCFCRSPSHADDDIDAVLARERAEGRGGGVVAGAAVATRRRKGDRLRRAKTGVWVLMKRVGGGQLRLAAAGRALALEEEEHVSLKERL